MNSWKLSDDKLRLTLTEEQDALWVTLDDLVGGKTWPKSPLTVVDVHDKTVRAMRKVDKYRIDLVEESFGGLHVVIGDRSKNISIGLWLRIQDGELVVTLSPAEVYENESELFRVFAVDVLPGLMRAGAGETVILPINTGLVFDPANKPELKDRFLIYGEQGRWELMPSLPVCAVHTRDGGLVALASACAADAECRVATDGKGSGSTGFAFSLRRFWPDPVDMSIREFRYTPMPADADPVVFTANRLRRHVMDDLRKPPLAERAKESQEVAYLLGAYIMKMFHAIENMGWVTAGLDKTSPVSFINCLTFLEAKQCLKMVREAGIEKVLTQSVGWNSRGHDGFYPARFPIEVRLGGEAGFRDMVEFGNNLGFNMNVHDNFMMGNKVSPDLDTDLLVHDIYGEPLIHGWWGGGIEYSHWPLALPEDRLAGHMRKMKSLGLKGMYYMDYMGQPLEVNYHPKHKGPRGKFEEGTALLLKEARKVFGSSGCESGFLYCSIDADCIAARPGAFHLKASDPSWPVTKLMEKIVPIWQIALHGLVINENSSGPTWKSAMDTVLMGDHPRDEWSARPHVHPALTEERVRAQKAMYDLAIVKYGYLQTVELMDLREIADGVRQSTFADGTQVTVDSNKEELFVNGSNVPRPEGIL